MDTPKTPQFVVDVNDQMPDGLQPVDPNILKGDKPVSIEEAIAAQYQELMEPAPETTDEPQEETEQQVEEVLEAPAEPDTPDEEIVEETASAEEVLDELELQALFEVEGNPVDLEEAKRGYLRQQDYSKKTELLAREREELENLQKQTVAERENYLEGLTRTRQLDDILHEEPDWASLKDEDPYEYAEQRANWDKVQARRKTLDDEIQRVHEEKQNEQMQQIADITQHEANLLLEKVPEWREKDVAQKFLGEMNTYLQTYGFSPEEIKSVTDHRLFLLCRDAMASQAGSSAEPLAQKKVAKARKGITRGQRTMGTQSRESSRIQQARDRLQSKDASLDDAIALQMAEIGLDYTDEMK